MAYFSTALRLGVFLIIFSISADAAEFVRSDPALTVLKSDSGVVGMEWAASSEEEGSTYELEKSTDPDFSEATVVYRGSDRSTHLSGFREGDYYFRVRESGALRWSEPLHVKVEFIGRFELFALLGVGFVVCAFTIVAVLKGHFERRAE